MYHTKCIFIIRGHDAVELSEIKLLIVQNVIVLNNKSVKQYKTKIIAAVFIFQILTRYIVILRLLKMLSHDAMHQKLDYNHSCKANSLTI